MNTSSERRYSFGHFELQPDRHLLLRDGVSVLLKPKIFDLLLLLVQSGGRLVTKEELMSSLWPDQFVEESNLPQSIYLLRMALSGNQGESDYIENIPRRGYRFTAEVRESSANELAGEQDRGICTIAVLPFTPLPGADRDVALEFGIAETLITGLSQIRALTVRQIGSIRKYGDARDSLAAARELKVEAVLDGTIQRSADRLRVTARLIRVEDQAILWAGKFDESFTDIFFVQDSICDRVLTALAIELPEDSKDRLLPRHTDDAEVHHLFLKCRYYWHKWTPKSWKRSIEYGQQAVARDPLHAPSYSWMAASYCTLGITGALPPGKAFRHAKELVGKALELDETLSEAHEVEGAIKLFHEWDWEAAEQTLQRALQLNPSSGEARDLYALLLLVTGRQEEAIREVRRAGEADPLSLIVNTDIGNVLYYARRYDAAIDQLQRTLELDPWFAHARFALGYTYLQKGRYADALAEIEAAVKYSGREKETSPDLAYALSASGDEMGARRILEVLLERSAKTFVDPYSLALVHVGLGARDEAFAWFEQAYKERSRELIYLRANPIFDSLHSYRRFTGFLQRIGV